MNSYNQFFLPSLVMDSWSACGVSGFVPGAWLPAVMKLQPWAQDTESSLKHRRRGPRFLQKCYLISSLQKPCRDGIVLIIQVRGRVREPSSKKPAPRSSAGWSACRCGSEPNLSVTKPCTLPQWGYLVLPLPLPVPLAHVFHLLQGHGPCLHLRVYHGHGQQVHLGRLWG